MKKVLLTALLCLGLLFGFTLLSQPVPGPEELDLTALPAYAGEPWAILNDDRPTFTEEELAFSGEPAFSPLDGLERRGPALALVGPETLPTAERGPIGQIKPPGWHTVRYDHIEGKYLYNRCHLIAYQLSGVNEEPLNLITGTRYLNVSAMLPLENLVAQYVRETGNHVLYRVTPLYEGENLLCDRLLLEARSVEDGGEGLSLCRCLYNVQPGVVIDYATGESRLEEGFSPETPVPTAAESPTSTEVPTQEVPEDVTYILNTRSGRFHLPDCPGAANISEKNRQNSTDTREELLAQGYTPCGTCKP